MADLRRRHQAKKQAAITAISVKPPSNLPMIASNGGLEPDSVGDEGSEGDGAESDTGELVSGLVPSTIAAKPAYESDPSGPVQAPAVHPPRTA